MILGLLLGIVGTSLVWGLVVGLCLSARERDEREAKRYDELPAFVPLKPVELLVADLSFPPWVNGTDAA